jgi:hypothetical protein
MRVLTYHELSIIEKAHFYTFLKSTQLESKPAGINMWHDDWSNTPNTLPFILENTDRFNSNNGEYYILFQGATIVACGGVYISDFSQDVALIGVRTWVSKNYRNNSILREHLLPIQKAWCQKNSIKILALSFNDYNKNIIQVFKKRRLGETKERIKTRKPHHLFYSNFNEVQFPVIVQYTKQWIVYEVIDMSVSFDWSRIAYKD